MSSKLYSISSDKELPVVYVFSVSQVTGHEGSRLWWSAVVAMGQQKVSDAADAAM